MDIVEKEINAVESVRDIYADIYNAKIFYQLFKDKIRWCKDYGGWFIYNDLYWERDTNDIIKRYAIKAHAHMLNDIEKVKDKKYFTHLKNSAADNKLNAMLNCSKAYLGTLSDEFDRDPYLINCQNVIFNLKENRPLEHSANCLLTRVCNASYDPKAQCPNWLKYLDKIFLGNTSMIDFMQELVGYSLTGDVSQQVFPILYGNGANGKSTFLDTIYKMLGGYAAVTPAATLTVKNGDKIPNDVARLKGIRLAIAPELESGKKLDESLIKIVTSNERIVARFLNREYFEFYPTAKIFLMTNHKPTISGTDNGIWRRIKLIPFLYQFTDAEKIEKYAEKFLFQELDGIFLWALEGWLRLQREGLKEPNIIQESISQYRMSEDTVAVFLDEFCLLGKDNMVLGSDLYEYFKKHTASTMAKKDFKDDLIKRGFEYRKGSKGKFKGLYTWFGIGLRGVEG
jgi:putative DNA primase/helicase